MPNKHTFPRKDAKFNSYVRTAIANLAAHRVRLKLSTGQISALAALLADWEAVWPKSQNQNLRTKTVTDDKNALRKKLQAALRAAYDDIPKSALKKSDEAALRIKAGRGKKKAKPKISDTPSVKITVRPGSAFHITCRREKKDGRPSRHPSAQAVEVKFQVGGARPASPRDCPNTFISTRPVFLLWLGTENAGQRLHAWFRWANFSQPAKSGPWSRAFSAIITD